MKIIFNKNEPRTVDDFRKFLGHNVLIKSEDYTIDSYLSDIEFEQDRTECHLLLHNTIGDGDYYEASYRISIKGIESIESLS
jgi:hypothetical protein